MWLGFPDARQADGESGERDRKSSAVRSFGVGEKSDHVAISSDDWRTDHERLRESDGKHSDDFDVSDDFEQLRVVDVSGVGKVDDIVSTIDENLCPERNVTG